MFSNSVKLFSINGFQIKIDPSWLLIAGLITWSLSRRYFPSVFPGEAYQTYLLMGVIAMLLFFASLLLHELAHSVVARRLGVPVENITLFLFGGVAELEAEPQSARVEFWVALAGPAMSLCLALGFWCLAQLAQVFPDFSNGTAVLSYLALVNLVLALFNLVPAFPLDGGRVLRAYLWHRTGDALRATEIASRSGTIFAYFLMAMGLFALFQGALIAGMWQMLLGGFVLFAARSSYRTQLARKVFEGKTVETLMNSAPIIVAPQMTLAEFVNRIMLQHRISFTPVVEDGVLLGHMDQTLLSGIDRENWANTHVGDVFAGLDPKTTVAPDMPIQDLLTTIAATRNRKFLVTEDHKLVGVITLADVTECLQIADALYHQ
ncbi:site-2 protease family protein [Roseobacter weihaiensis]|uniref:site-2 protease family protein n=1 Tax=Roseobacter weihaiensis TaxID=2763262 RepID=UPI001D0AE9C1|nr:site-2 protease family protein [Roseobacter sp. H9]